MDAPAATGVRPPAPAAITPELRLAMPPGSAQETQLNIMGQFKDGIMGALLLRRDARRPTLLPSETERTDTLRHDDPPR